MASCKAGPSPWLSCHLPTLESAFINDLVGNGWQQLKLQRLGGPCHKPCPVRWDALSVELSPFSGIYIHIIYIDIIYI